MASRNYFSIREDDDEEEDNEGIFAPRQNTQTFRKPIKSDVEQQTSERPKGRNRFSAANIDVSDSEEELPEREDEELESIPYNDLQEEQKEFQDFQMSQQKQEPFTRFSGSFLPQQLELPASKMHVMKSLMFDAPKQFEEDFSENTAEYSLDTSYLPPRREQLPRKHWDTTEYSKVPTQVPRAIETTHAVPVNKIALGLLDLQKSKTKDTSNCVADAGLFLGRSFRVGWGPTGLIAHRGNRQNSDGGHSKALGVLTVEKVSIDPTFQRDFVGSKKIFKALLEDHQKNSQFLESGEEAGTFSLKNAEAMLKSYIEINALDATSGTFKEFQENFTLVWKLVDALWGDMQNSDPSDYEEEKRRRNRLSSWIEAAVALIVLTEAKQTSSSLETIFTFLTGRQIQSACTKALGSKDLRLSTLIAQAGSHDLRQLISQQLQEWESNGTIQFLEEDRLRIFRLLSGNIKEYVINSESLARDWKRCLGMILWYVTPLNSEIAACLQEFEESVKHPSGSIYPPAPKYFNPSSVDQVSEFQDVNYHLLHLYVDQSYPMEKVLHPRSFTSQPLDYHLSWHMYTVLKALCFPKLTEKHLYSLHINYAFQLEFNGLWEWSIYVLLHLPSQTNKEEDIKSRAIKNFLTRNAHLISGDTKSFLLNVLKIPSPWIEEALSWSAHTTRNTEQEIKYLFGAGDWNSIHKILLSSVAPQAILDDSLERLRKYFKDLEPHSNTIEGWSKGGKQYLDYISLCSFISSLKEEKENVKDYSSHPQKYRQLLQMDSLASQILQWLVDKPCSSDIQRVSVSDMTTQVYQYKKWFKQMISDLNPPHTSSSSSSSHMLLDAGLSPSALAVFSPSPAVSIYGDINELSMLSIPENYRLSLMNSMTTDYLSFLTAN